MIDNIPDPEFFREIGHNRKIDHNIVWAERPKQPDPVTILPFPGDVQDAIMFLYRAERALEVKCILSMENGQAKSTQKFNRPKLLKTLRESFGGQGVKDLCFHLDIDYDDLSGEGKTDKLRELITKLEQEDRIPELITFCKRERPKKLWDDVVNL